ncbi:Cytochrome bd-I ubiquinol oxidase subunit 2 [Planctomycetes bacterium Pan216]|uniref:Cytochrome bd-I ubiquinol oxidase subunit 2 n=1 Tax=Kolteria novifilia TaxID=2527975 RepID=A0A518AZA3_9BACT|nr:Cytochrome bd-I ubiquinol oxidase subunit 2 [Planctomycetes bacterium Pan216]
MTELEVLQYVWYILLGFLLAGYACLDGFDLGVGIIHPFQRGDDERRTAMNAIGPLWDGNEVWLVTFGGALFATFPIAYSTAFQGFYIPFLILLTCLIFRSVSLEFRSKRPSLVWRYTWDMIFFLSSLGATFLYGVAVGNMVHGLRLDAEGHITDRLWNLLHPYCLVVGGLAVATFAMHGSIFLYMRTDASQRERTYGHIWSCIGFFLIFFYMATVFTLYFIPSSTRNFVHFPWAWIIVIGTIFAIANIPRSIFHHRPFQAFLSSCATICGLVALFGIALFPNLVTSSISPEYSLTIHNASSAVKTLRVCLIIAIIGMPFVITYTACIYWVFRGKVQMGHFSY